MWQSGTIRVARIGGIAVELHITFVFVIGWGAWEGWSRYGGPLGALYGILVISLLFASVLLHELGHGLQAKAFGLKVRRIILTLIGGLTELESQPSSAWHELMITLAGPFLNLGLALIFLIISFLIHPLTLSNGLEQFLLLFFSPPSAAGLTLYLFAANMLLFLFNMLPAFPMDGGRVLRATLALVVNYELATRLATGLGLLLALPISLFGLVGWPPAGIPPNPLLLLVGFMVFFGARHEQRYVRRQRALVRVEVHMITQRDPEIIAPWEAVTGPLVARLFRHSRTLPVMLEGRVVGLLAYHDLRRLSGHNSVTVAHLMRSTFPSVKLTDTLWVALREMDTFQLAALPVIEDGVFHGIVSREDIDTAWRFAVRRGRSKKAMLIPGERL